MAIIDTKTKKFRKVEDEKVREYISQVK